MRATARVKHSFSKQHLAAARLFARLAAEIESCPSGGRAKSGPPSARVRVTANIERSSLALGEHCATLGEFVEWLAQRHDDFLTLAVRSQMLRQALVPAL